MSAIKLVAAAAALFAASMALGAPMAAAQQGDLCGEFRTVLDETAAPAADPAQQTARTGIHNLVQRGFDALQCAGAAPLASPIELSRQFLSAGYQSRCTANGQAPMPPAGRLTTRQFNEAVPAFNNWAEANNASLRCRAEEVGELRRQRAIAGAAVAVWNWRTQRQAEDAATAFSQAQPRRARGSVQR